MQTEKHIHTHTNTRANMHTCSQIHINTVTHTKMRFKFFFLSQRALNLFKQIMIWLRTKSKLKKKEFTLQQSQF